MTRLGTPFIWTAAMCAISVATLPACGGDEAEHDAAEGEGEGLRSTGELPGEGGGGGGEGEGEGDAQTLPIPGTAHDDVIISARKGECPSDSDEPTEGLSKDLRDEYALDLGAQPASTQDAVVAGSGHVVTFGFLPEEATEGYKSFSEVRACLKVDDTNQECSEGPCTAGQRHTLGFKPNTALSADSVVQVRMTGTHWMACPDGEPAASVGSVNLTFGSVTLEYAAAP